MTSTARDRIIEALRQHPEGLSRRQLHQEVACNLGILRQQVASLESTGVITITEEDREYGPTRVHRLNPVGRPQIAGQTSIDDD